MERGYSWHLPLCFLTFHALDKTLPHTNANQGHGDYDTVNAGTVGHMMHLNARFRNQD